jgi:glutamyl-tRNA synthetase
MTVTTRFAPSPTGRIHVGNIRTALHNWLYARQQGGRFLLRIDDTDQARSEERFVEAIRHDLGWLGIDWDGEERQSARFDAYEARFAALREAGRVYPCYETPQELDLKRKVQLGRGLPPVYDRSALQLTDAGRARLEGEGLRPHWRFKLDHAAPIIWRDLIRGDQSFDPKLMSDPVVRRADGSWLYLLPSVIDDIDMGITHVVRGEDHVSNTATQVQMFEALGAAPPAFAHEALLTGAEGKLSKRAGATDVDHWRETGIEPLALAAKLARIGTSLAVEAVAAMQPLIDAFDFGTFGRAPARFDEAELAKLNAQTIHLLSFDQVHERLPENMDARAWEVVRPNLEKVSEAGDWWQVISGDVTFSATDEDRAFIAEAARAAGEIDWSADPWHALTGLLKERTGRKGKPLFLPLRQALTGRDHGPDMAALLPLIGRERALARLAAAASA